MFCVCALNALQNSMMLRPRWPSAGPIGGDGFALPAGTCSLIKPTIFFAIAYPWREPATLGLYLLDLRILELDRGRTAEDRNRDLEPRFLLVDLLDDAVERGERPVRDAHLLADLEADRRLRPLDPFLHLAHDPRRLGLADRRRPGALAAEKAGDLGGVLDQMPGLVVEIHLDQHVAGKELALGADLRAALDLDDLLGRHQDLVEAVGEALLLGLLADRGRDLFLEPGIDVDHVPAGGHRTGFRHLRPPARTATAHPAPSADRQRRRRSRRRTPSGTPFGS